MTDFFSNSSGAIWKLKKEERKELQKFEFEDTTGIMTDVNAVVDIL